MIPQAPVDGADARHVLCRADAVLYELVADLPGEHRWTLLLVPDDGVDDRCCGHLRLRAADDAWSRRASLVVPANVTLIFIYKI